MNTLWRQGFDLNHLPPAAWMAGDNPGGPPQPFPPYYPPLLTEPHRLDAVINMLGRWFLQTRHRSRNSERWLFLNSFLAREPVDRSRRAWLAREVEIAARRIGPAFAKEAVARYDHRLRESEAGQPTPWTDRQARWKPHLCDARLFIRPEDPGAGVALVTDPPDRATQRLAEAAPDWRCLAAISRFLAGHGLPVPAAAEGGPAASPHTGWLRLPLPPETMPLTAHLGTNLIGRESTTHLLERCVRTEECCSVFGFILRKPHLDQWWVVPREGGRFELALNPAGLSYRRTVNPPSRKQVLARLMHEWERSRDRAPTA